jgi:hypothetical protein
MPAKRVHCGSARQQGIAGRVRPRSHVATLFIISGGRRCPCCRPFGNVHYGDRCWETLHRGGSEAAGTTCEDASCTPWRMGSRRPPPNTNSIPGPPPRLHHLLGQSSLRVWDILPRRAVTRSSGPGALPRRLLRTPSPGEPLLHLGRGLSSELIRVSDDTARWRGIGQHCAARRDRFQVGNTEGAHGGVR